MKHLRPGLGLLLVLLLAGCGGGQDVPEQLTAPAAVVPSASAGPADDDAGAAATPAPAAEPAADATQDVDELGFETTLDPEEARVAAREVEQAVRDYYAAINRAQYEGDVAGLEALSIPECPCRQLVDIIREESTYGRTEGAAWTLNSVDVRVVTEDSASATADLTVADGRVVAPDGTTAIEIDNLGGGTTTVALLRHQMRWLVAQTIRS